MGKSRAKAEIAPPGDVVIADGEALNLRNRHLAALLAWLIPGAGHLYQQRYVKSFIFFVCIMSSFTVGLFVAGGRSVYASWNETERRWQFVLQAGVGLPAMPAVFQSWRVRNNQLPVGQFMAPPQSPADLDDWHHETASGFDMGTLYTMVAGLLNILAVFDAYGGPLPPPGNPKRKKSGGDGDGDGEKKKSEP
jgi:hypothetical protein